MQRQSHLTYFLHSSTSPLTFQGVIVYPLLKWENERRNLYFNYGHKRQWMVLTTSTSIHERYWKKWIVDISYLCYSTFCQGYHILFDHHQGCKSQLLQYLVIIIKVANLNYYNIWWSRYYSHGYLTCIFKVDVITLLIILGWVLPSV